MNRFWLILGLAGFLFGGCIGGSLMAHIYGGRLDAVRLEQARCVEVGQALEAQLAQQNQQVDALALAARQRATEAERALAVAREQADGHEARGRRLLLEHSDGEDCSVVRQLIDRELLP